MSGRNTNNEFIMSGRPIFLDLTYSGNVDAHKIRAVIPEQSIDKLM